MHQRMLVHARDQREASADGELVVHTHGGVHRHGDWPAAVPQVASEGCATEVSDSLRRRVGPDFVKVDRFLPHAVALQIDRAEKRRG
eukprot:4660759-Pleurochrysis_carterae.AAC.5